MACNWWWVYASGDGFTFARHHNLHWWCHWEGKKVIVMQRWTMMTHVCHPWCIICLFWKSLGLSNRKESVENVYLPISMGYCNCYKHYMTMLGYEVCCKVIGAMMVVGQNGKPVEHGYLSFTSYYNLWKSNFLHLKVSRPIEDICQYCFVFANRHRYLANHSAVASEGGVEPGVEGGIESAATQAEEDCELLLLESAMHVQIRLFFCVKIELQKSHFFVLFLCEGVSNSIWVFFEVFPKQIRQETINALGRWGLSGSWSAVPPKPRRYVWKKVLNGMGTACSLPGDCCAGSGWRNGEKGALPMKVHIRCRLRAEYGAAHLQQGAARMHLLL